MPGDPENKVSYTRAALSRPQKRNRISKVFCPNFPAERAIFLLLVFSALIWFGSPASAQSLSLTPSSGPGGLLVTATTSGFLPNTNGEYGNTGFYYTNSSGYIFITACPPPVGVSSWANCSVNFHIPVDREDVTIIARYGTASASATFTVKSPTMSIAPTWGPPGTSVTVRGSTFDVDAYASVFVDDVYQTEQITDDSGNFTASFNMPAASNGPHIVKVVCGQKVSVTFYISTDGIGSATDLQGTATITHPGGQPMPMQPGMPISMGDRIQTGPNSTVSVSFVDGTLLNVSENGKLTVDEYIYDPNNNANNRAHYNFLEGAFQYLSGLIAKKPDPDVHVETLYGEIGIRGTQFISRRDPCSVTQEIYLIEGELAITPLATPGVTNIVDAPASIFMTTNSVTTNTLNQATYDAISNSLFQVTGPVTLGSWLTYYFGCTNGNPAAAPGADPDGDGVSNENEFLAGTDPTSAASAFRILSATPEGSNLRVNWTCGGGRTNVLQAAASLNGPWSDISPNIALAGSGDSITNFLDPGVVTNATPRFYRVRLQ